MKQIDTYHMGLHTLIGVFGTDYPLSHGNCFSLVDEKDYHIRIVDFVLENLEELLKRNVVDWPIKVTLLNDRYGVISDDRIPKDWCLKEYCSICCPDEFQPQSYHDKRKKMIESGEIKIKKIGDETVEIRNCKAPKGLTYIPITISNKTVVLE